MTRVHTQSRILQTFRALGVVASDVPVAYSRAGFITAAIGKSFQVYETEKLTPVAVSAQLPKKIRALTTVLHKNQTFCAVGRDIHVFERVKETTILQGHSAPITHLLAVGEYLFSTGEDHTMRVTLELVNSIEFADNFTPTVLLHPATYLNKIVVGSAQGELQLWNVRTLKCIYSFKVYIHLYTMQTTLTTVLYFQGWGSEVTSVAQSPAVDVAAIGLADGRIFVHNLKFDVTLMQFAQPTEGRVTSLSFRNDDKSPWLASGTSSGDVILWNLETQRLQAKIPVAHDADVATVLFLPSEPVLLTSSGDNSIKLWIFDQLDQTARLLKSRQGHKAPPTTIRYYGHDIQKDGMVCQILSASQDRSFRLFHTAREQQSAELSQGPLLKKAKRHYDFKLSPIVQLAAIDTRENSCGNFALVGSQGGAIYLYNMQSGEKRGSFPTAATDAPKLIKSLTLPGASYVSKATDGSLEDKHTAAVTGVAVDVLNETVVSTSLDGLVKFWSFSSHSVVGTLDLKSPITQIELHKESGLVAVACDDFVVRVVDLSTKKVVRQLRGHVHQVTDVTFSPDARWLVTSAADGSLRVWDLPTGKCIDFVKFKHAVTSLSMSPTGEFIATAHTGQVGIYLWANRSYFENVFVDKEPTDAIAMGMPVPLSEEEMPLDVHVETAAAEEDRVGHQTSSSGASDLFESPIDTSTGLVTLSTAPKAMWQSLFQLELIKKRNKPKQAPQAPPLAPFFLPTVRKEDVHPTFESHGVAPTKKTKKTNASTTSSSSTTTTTNPESTVDEAPMAGWGGPDDDQAWGDDDDDNDVTDNNKSTLLSGSSRIVKSSGLTSSRSKLATLLELASTEPSLPVEGGSATAYKPPPVLAYLQSLSASGVDVELSTLCMGEFDEEGKRHLTWFLDFLVDMVAHRQQFQVVQVYLNRFVKVHEDIVVGDAALLAKVQTLHTLQQQAWEHLQQLLQHNLCLVQYLSKMQM
ncbi:hypothetical protein B5M09_005620 [Aphanomyces astaci]|uniref:Uncharacterized protein n=1 Tax=Aphanomyces astaci TaxID=112090 RepID=A0A425CPX4_APHAT|nr:hypothetical protein B5M09_005620 [Aphanomyces astaci]